MTPEDAQTSAERHVISDLESKGYYCIRNKRSPGYTGVEAIKGTEVVLVHVKTAVHPSTPDNLSAEESTRIRSRATRMGWEAWLAQVQIDDLGLTVGSISYTRLV
jgi:Holliday junction resolvase